MDLTDYMQTPLTPLPSLRMLETKLSSGLPWRTRVLPPEIIRTKNWVKLGKQQMELEEAIGWK